MSYQTTAIRLFGVKLTHREASQVLELAGQQGLKHELQRQGIYLAETFERDIYDLEVEFEDLLNGAPASDGYRTLTTPVEFLDHYGFPAFQVPPPHADVIPTARDERRGVQYHRFRYHADLFCEDADSRGKSLRLLPGRTSIYGIYIASDGYAYHDDLSRFGQDPRIEANFQVYCMHTLESLGLARRPSLFTLHQVW